MPDYCGMPGLVWYSDVQKVLGADLEIDQWLDTLDHRGARAIYSIDPSPPDSPVRTIRFDGIRYGILEDSEVVRKDVLYDVVNPDSLCTPDGNPMGQPGHCVICGGTLTPEDHLFKPVCAACVVADGEYDSRDYS